MNLSELANKFPPQDIEWRVQSSGKKGNGEVWAKVLAYITSRAIMERLDEVCGIENWKNEFIEAPNGGVLCGISIKCAGEWVTKWDGAENTAVEAVKGGLSSSMKRAGVQWGIGRYLYNLDTGWAKVNQNGKHSSKTKDNTWFKWDEPALPLWALPENQPDKLTKAETKDVYNPVIDNLWKHFNNSDADGFKETMNELNKKEKEEIGTLLPKELIDYAHTIYKKAA